MPSLYELLGLHPSADPDTVTQAWRRLARLHHPDLNVGDEAAAVRFQSIVEAYHVLGHAERRKDYDLQAGFAKVPAGRNGNGTRGRVPDRALSLSVPYRMNLEGGVLDVEAPGVGRCGVCGGKGAVAARNDEPCARCDGSGQEEPPRVYPIRIEEGLLEGSTFRIPNAGYPSDGAGRGDLVVRVTLADPPGMRRDGSVLYTTATVRASVAHFGGAAVAPGADGPHRFQLPAGTSDGAHLSFPGFGLRPGRGAPRDPLIVTVRVE